MPGDIQAPNAINGQPQRYPIMTEEQRARIMKALKEAFEKRSISTIYGEFRSGDTSYEQYRGSRRIFAKRVFKEIDSSIKKDGYLDGLEICNYRDYVIKEKMLNDKLEYLLTFGWLRKSGKQKYLEKREHLMQLQKETDDYRKYRAEQDAQKKSITSQMPEQLQKKFDDLGQWQKKSDDLMQLQKEVADYRKAKLKEDTQTSQMPEPEQLQKMLKEKW